MAPDAKNTIAGNVVCCRDISELARQAGEYISRIIRHAAQSQGAGRVALAGGSTPVPVYKALASPSLRKAIPWERVHLFWGDERCVPPDHDQSNYRMVEENLLE